MPNKRLKGNLFFQPLKEKCFTVRIYKSVKIDNNFITEFKEYLKLKDKGFKLIMFENCIFYNTLCPEIYNNFKTIN